MITFLLKAFRAFKPIWHQVMLSVFGVTFTCAHTPSCSHYTHLQIKQHGTIVGLYRGLIRLGRCWSGSLT